MRVVLTGIARSSTLHILRDDLIASAHAQGIAVDSVVRYNTSYLITDSDKKTVKRKRAELFGVPIISTDKFIEDVLGGEIEIPRTLSRGSS